MKMSGYYVTEIQRFQIVEQKTSCLRNGILMFN